MVAAPAPGNCAIADTAGSARLSTRATWTAIACRATAFAEPRRLPVATAARILPAATVVVVVIVLVRHMPQRLGRVMPGFAYAQIDHAIDIAAAPRAVALSQFLVALRDLGRSRVGGGRILHLGDGEGTGGIQSRADRLGDRGRRLRQRREVLDSASSRFSKTHSPRRRRCAPSADQSLASSASFRFLIASLTRSSFLRLAVRQQAGQCRPHLVSAALRDSWPW